MSRTKRHSFTPAVSVPGFAPPNGSFWLFAYGSLMWAPAFRYQERCQAVLDGYHRALCVYSWVYRGTEASPGLVFGLDRGGITKGIAYRIRAIDAKAVYEAVHAREMVTAVYRPAWVRCRLPGTGRAAVTALTYIANPSHRQYAGRLSDKMSLDLVQSGAGCAGPCTDYIESTADHLRALGIRDLALERIVRRLG